MFDLPLVYYSVKQQISLRASIRDGRYMYLIEINDIMALVKLSLNLKIHFHRINAKLIDASNDVH